MNELQDLDIKEIAEIVSTTLKQNSIDTQLASLEGLLSRLKIEFWKLIRVKLNDELIYPLKTPTFFYLDYELISDDILKKYVIQRIISAPMMFDDTIVDITENKRFYLLSIVIENEIIRLKLQKKKKWNGKIHEVFVPFSITKDQEKKIDEIFNKYDFCKDVSHYTVINNVANYNLSSIYRKKQTKKVCSLLRELTMLLGDAWGKRAALYTTNGEKSLQDIKKNYYSFN